MNFAIVDNATGRIVQYGSCTAMEDRKSVV